MPGSLTPLLYMLFLYFSLVKLATLANLYTYDFLSEAPDISLYSRNILLIQLLKLLVMFCHCFYTVTALYIILFNVNTLNNSSLNLKTQTEVITSDWCSKEERKKKSEVTQSCLTLCDPMDCSLPGPSVHRIFQARILEWVTISFSRGSSQPRDQTWVSPTVGRCFTV